MFTALYPLAKLSPIAMCLTQEGEKLRVVIQQKETKKGTPLSLSVVATPEELDDELAASIAAAAGADLDTQAVAEQVKAQLSTEPKATTTPKSGSAEKSTKPRAAAGDKQPSKTERKATVVDEYVKHNRAHMRKHGKPITREAFIEAIGNRDWERLFGNWTKLKTAGEKAMKEAPPVDTDTKPLELDEPGTSSTEPATSAEDAPAATDNGAPGPGADPAEEAATPATTATPQREWPFPTAQTAAPDAPPAVAPTLWEVNLLDGTRLFAGVPTKVLDVGVDIDHEGEAYLVDSVSAEDHAVWVRRKLRNVVLEDGTVVGSETRDPEPGSPITLGEVVHTVLRADSEQIVVIAPPPPPKVRNIVDDEGEKLGTYEGEIDVGGEITLEAGSKFTVVRVTEKAVFVEAADVPAGA